MSANQKGAKIVVYWLEKSRGQRIVWLLEELNLEYEVKVFRRGPDFRAGPDLKQIHALGKSPVVGITPAGSDKETILAESEVVIDYLCEHFGPQLIPPKYPPGKEGELCAETEEYMRYKFLMGYTEGSLFTYLLLALVNKNIEEAPVPFFLKPITRGVAGKVNSGFLNPEFKTNFDFLEDYLAKSPSKGEFFCSHELTGADIMLHFALEGATQRVPLTEESYPGLYKYMRRLQERDGYKRAAARMTEASGDKFVPFSDLKL